MSALELRCRLVLLAYPAGHREKHGGEILGTLLEATPDGRAWPLPGDIAALVIAGLGARCGQNRQGTTWANVLIGVAIGVAAYLCLDASQWVRNTSILSAAARTAPLGQFAGPVWLAPTLVARCDPGLHMPVASHRPRCRIARRCTGLASPWEPSLPRGRARRCPAEPGNSREVRRLARAPGWSLAVAARCDRNWAWLWVP